MLKKPIRSKAIRESARGEDCTLQIAGVCSYRPETVVLCHFPDESHGVGRKSDDISAGYGCSACHDWIDRRVKGRDEEAEWYMRRSQTRTLRRLIERGIVVIKG